MKVVIAVPTLSALTAVAALSAQAPADRAALESFRDSIAEVSDSAPLLQLEARLIAVAKVSRDSALLHLQLGFLAYRLGDVGTSKNHFEDAAGEFQWASELRPDWPYPWYGLGLAEFAKGEWSNIPIENLRQQLGIDYLSKSAKAFAHAIEVDPTFGRAAVDLANTALSQRIRPQLDAALQALRSAARTAAGRIPDVQLARGRVEREAGEADSAAGAFEAYLKEGGDSGIGALELARAEYLANRPGAGWQAYFRGAHVATTPAAIRLYRQDAAFVGSPEELAAFDRLGDPDARGAWLEHFWRRRDIAQARDEGERLAEHYRRWFFARRNFRLVSPHRHYDITERYRSDQTEFDDRGIVYIRHGPPDLLAIFPSDIAGGLEPNESWLYRRTPPDPDLVFHFVSRGDGSDFKLVESLADAVGFSGAVAATGGARDDYIVQLYQSRENFGDLYARIANGHSLAQPLFAEERDEGRQAIMVGTQQDSYRRVFEEALEPIVSDFVVGDRSDDTTSSAGIAPRRSGMGGQVLHVVFAIPGDRLTPVPNGHGVLYPLQFRLIVADPRDSLVGQLDTLRVFSAPQPVRSPTYLTGRLAIPVPPGEYRYRLLIMTPDAGTGTLVRRDSLDVDTLTVARFAASDLVLGLAGSGLQWTTGRDTVLLNPLGRWPQGSVAEMYLELYGLKAGAPYHTVVGLEKPGKHGLFGKKRPAVMLEFDAAADGPVTRVHRGVDLRRVSTGSYRLTVTLTDPATGRSVSRSAPLQVVNPKELHAER